MFIYLDDVTYKHNIKFFSLLIKAASHPMVRMIKVNIFHNIEININRGFLLQIRAQTSFAIRFLEHQT